MMRLFTLIATTFLLMLATSQKTTAQNCTVNAGLDQAICTGTSLVLNTANVGGTYVPNTLVWTQTSGPGTATITNGNSIGPTFSNLVTGAYVFRISNTCTVGGTVFDEVTVTVNAGATSVTPTMSGFTNGGCYTPGTPITLTGTQPAGHTLSWGILSNSGSAATFNGAINTTYTGSSPTIQMATPTNTWCNQNMSTVTIHLTSTNNTTGCQTTSTFSINYWVNSGTVNAWAPTDICGTCVDLLGSCDQNSNGTWSVVSGPNTPAFSPNANAPFAKACGLVAGSYTFRWTVNAAAPPCNISGQANVSVNVIGSGAGLVLADAGPSRVFCAGTMPGTLTLTGNTPGALGTPNWVQFSGAPATITNPNSPVTSVTGLTEAGSPYMFIYSVTGGGCGTFDTVSVRVGSSMSLNSYSQNYCQTQAAMLLVSGVQATLPNRFAETIEYKLTYLNGPADTVLHNHPLQTDAFVDISNRVPGSNVYTPLLRGATWSSGVWTADQLWQLNSETWDIFVYDNITAMRSANAGCGPNAMAQGTYSFRTEIVTPCSTYSRVFTLIVGLQGGATTAGTDQQLLCGSNSTSLAGSLINCNLNPFWTTITKPTGAANPINSGNINSANAPVTGLLPGIYEFVWQATPAPVSWSSCSSGKDTVKVVVSNVPPATPVIAGGGVTICSGSRRTVTATPAPQDGIGVWTVTSSPAISTYTILPNANSPAITFIPTTVGTVYTLTWTVTNGCGSASANTSITSNAITAILPNITTANKCYTANNGALGTFDATAAGGVWSTNNPLYTPNTPNAASTTITPSSYDANRGSFVLYYTLNNAATGGCGVAVDSATVTMDYFNFPAMAPVISASDFCSVTSFPVTIPVTFTQILPYVHYNLSAGGPGSPTLSSYHIYQTPTVLPSAMQTVVVNMVVSGPGTYTVSIDRAYTGECSNMENSLVSKTINVSDPAPLADAGADFTICGGTGAGNLAGSPNPLPANTSGLWTIDQIISGTAPVIANASSPASAITFSRGGEVRLKWTTTGANRFCPGSVDYVIVKHVPAANAGSDIATCFTAPATSTSASLSGNNPVPSTGTWSLVSGPAGSTFSNPSNYNTTISGLTAGTYTLRWTIAANNGCPATTDDVVVRVTNSCGISSISNYVWHDADADGIQDATEKGMSGVVVTLYNEAGAPVATALTDANGLYMFSGLDAGLYTVGFTPPADYTFTTQTSGTATGSDPAASGANYGKTNVINLAYGENYADADAGLIYTAPPAKIGDYVWFDSDNDGVQDATEEGMAGITVTLYDGSGNVVATTVTDANGYYQFAGVAPGTYSVGFTLPAGMRFSPKDATGDAADSDVNTTGAGFGRTDNFTIVAGQQKSDIDAGIRTQATGTASVGDKVWNDLDNDGLQDAGEPGIAGARVDLYNASNVLIATTYTDAFGNYMFTNLAPGNYYIDFTKPTGYDAVTKDIGSNHYIDSDADPVTGQTAVFYLMSNEIVTSVDAGFTNPSTNTAQIGDKVWFDADRDGVQDATEAGVRGVTVELFRDVNGDGDYLDAGESVPVATTITDANGNYIFTDLPAGTYMVKFSNIPNGYEFTSVNNAGPTFAGDNDARPDGSTPSFTLTAGQIELDIDAGLRNGPVPVASSSLGDRVWIDLDADNIQDANETGLAGITVTLYAADGVTVIATTVTNGLGYYTFPNLQPGDYIVGFGTLPNGFNVVTANSGSNDDIDSDVNTSTRRTTAPVTVLPGQNNLSVDMGVGSSGGFVDIGNKVWIDQDNDNVQDATEPGLAGVPVYLYDAFGVIVQQVLTDANGNYTFSGLPQNTNYTIGVGDLPAGFSLVTKDLGGDDATDSDIDVVTKRSAVINTGTADNFTYDIGVRSTTTAYIGNYVWLDTDGDNAQDATEAGVPGVTVTLYASNGTTVVATAITDANGFYSFPNVAPGTYVVGYGTIPGNATFVTKEGTASDPLGSNVNVATGKTDAFTVSAGDVRTDIDAGVQVPRLASIGDYVWFDQDADGQQDIGIEPPVPGIRVTLLASDGSTVIATAVTDGNGKYMFDNIAVPPAGTNYYVQFHLNAGYAFTTANTGSDATDSDVNTATGITTVNFALLPGTTNISVDAGLVFTILPLSKLDVTASLSGNTATIDWTTIDEINTRRFVVERSTSGSLFTDIGSVSASGNTSGKTNYTLPDNVSALMANPVIYYRVRLEDLDGKTYLSKVVAVRIHNSVSVQAWPNPFNDVLNVSIKSTVRQQATYDITDVAGRRMLNGTLNVLPGTTQLQLPGIDKLINGVYLLRIQDGEKTTVVKLVKQ